MLSVTKKQRQNLFLRSGNKYSVINGEYLGSVKWTSNDKMIYTRERY